MNWVAAKMPGGAKDAAPPPPPPPPPPLTVMAAVPENTRLPPGLVASVRPVMVSDVVVLSRPRADRGVMVTIASGIPSPFWSTGSAVMTASGKATPLMTIVVGSMSVTGLKSGSTSALLKTKICRSAGVVALTVNGPKGWPTPIWVVIAVLTGIWSGTNAPSRMKTPPFSARVWSSAKPGAPMMKSATRSASAVSP